jgi:thiol:disulfide interchange protein
MRAGPALTRGRQWIGVQPMSGVYRPVILIVLVALGVVAYVGWQKHQSSLELVPWRNDFSTAQQEARASRKPVLAYFTAGWCGPCQKMKTTTWNDPTVEHVLQGYVPVKIDIDQHNDLARKYEADRIPLFVVLDDAGKPVKRYEGMMYADEFVRWVKSQNASMTWSRGSIGAASAASRWTPAAPLGRTRPPAPSSLPSRPSPAAAPTSRWTSARSW